MKSIESTGRSSILAMVLTVALLLGAAGCTTQKTATTATLATSTEVRTVTAFGTVQCAENLALVLPAAVGTIEWYAIAGQSIPPKTAVLKIDMGRLLLIRDQLDQELLGLQTAIAGYELQHKGISQMIESVQAALDAFDVEKALGLLDALARAGTRSKREACEAELLAYLDQIGSLDQYHALVALTADKDRVKGNARPVFMQKAADLQGTLQTQAVRLLEVERLIHVAAGELLLLTEKTVIMKDICAGQEVCGIGSFDREGVFMSGDRPLLLNRRPDACSEVAPGGQLAEFACLDTVQLLVNIEEQLIPGIQAGAEVQISPLYNKGVVWLGTVRSISDRADMINGETVIPVIISMEDQMAGPGYNVVVKIKTEDD